MLFAGFQYREIAQRASAAVVELLPPQYDSAPDLRNGFPVDLSSDKHGDRVAGAISVADIVPGAPSPALWLTWMPLTLLAAVCVIVYAVLAIVGVYVPLSMIPETWRAQSGGVIDSTLGTIWDVYVGMVIWSAVGLVPMTILYWSMYAWISEQDLGRYLYRTALWTYIVGAGLILLIPGLGPLVGMLISGACLFVPRLYIGGYVMAREQNLRDATNDSRTASMRRDQEAMEEARRRQAASSLRDTSPLIPLGRSMGVLRRDGDRLTPDPGATLAMSVEDLSTHLWVLGATGTGKTVFLRPFVKAWVERTKNGALVLDGMKGLPAELGEKKAGGLLDLVVTPETATINILRGVDPEVASSLMYTYCRGKGTGGGSDVWDKATESMVRNALMLLKCATSRDDARVASGEPRAYPDWSYSIRDLYRFTTQMKLRDALLKALRDSDSDYITDHSHLVTAYEYWNTSVREWKDETRTSVEFTLNAWLNPLVSHSRLGRWCGDSADCVDIPDLVCRGARVGLVAPPYVYGQGGALAAALIKSAMYNRVKLRSVNPRWKEEGETDVLLMIDEAIGLLDKGDAEVASVARSLGLRMVFASQTHEQLLDKLGSQAAALSLLDQFRSRVTFRTSTESVKLACDHAGTRHRWMPAKDNVHGAPLLSTVRAELEAGRRQLLQGRAVDVLSSVMSSYARMRRIMRGDIRSMNDELNELRRLATVKGTIEQLPTITPAELGPYLDQKFTALVVVNRSGTPRREVVDLTPPGFLAPLTTTVDVPQDAIRMSKESRKIAGSQSNPGRLPRQEATRAR